MIISEVKTDKERKDFIEISSKIYEKETNWIRPLDKDINAVFDKKLNKAFRKGEVVRWVLMDKGNVIGRIAAFYSKKTKPEKRKIT